MSDSSTFTTASQENTQLIVTDEEIHNILENYYGFKKADLKKLFGYDDLNYYCSPKETINPYVKKLWPHGYVLKIMNSFDSQFNELTEFQNNILFFLKKHNISAPVPVKNLFEDYYFKIKIAQGQEECQSEHIVRVLEFQTGSMLFSIPKSYNTCYKLGQFTGKLNEVLMSCPHKINTEHDSRWYLRNAPELKKYISYVKNPEERQLVQIIIDDFITIVLRQEDEFEKGIIHGDINPHNVLMAQNLSGEWDVSAILDFGDSHPSNYTFEVSIALSYLMIECTRYNLDFTTGAGHFLAGYLKTRQKFLVKYDLLKICICARLCQSLVLGLKAYSSNPKNFYVLDSQDVGWKVLKNFWEMSLEEISQIWKSVNCERNLQCK